MFLGTVMCSEMKKAVVSYFRVTSETEKNCKVKVAYVLIEMQFRQVYRTNISKRCYQ
jgi:hypothetical protein